MEDKITEEEKYDGKWLLRTNTNLPVDEIALRIKNYGRKYL